MISVQETFGKYLLKFLEVEHLFLLRTLQTTSRLWVWILNKYMHISEAF